MTLLMIWRDESGISVAADSRISNENSTLTDIGQKIFSIPVFVTPFGVSMSNSGNGRYFPNIGLAFVGNTLLAQATAALVATLLSSLAAENADEGPITEDVAELVKRCLNHVVNEQMFWRSIKPAVEIVLFGISSDAHDFNVYDIYFEMLDGKYESKMEAVSLKAGGISFLGSGSDSLIRRLEEKSSVPGSVVHPLNLLREIISEGDEKSVGGGIQFARLSSSGFKIHPVMEVNRSGLAELSVLGVPASKIGLIGKFVSFQNAVAIEVD
ncbi:hypothetical protein VDG03_19085 [Xanthomonas campestris pv. raphani]|uniref:hypothetical protein n=1 Tax=Xanthomonas campestris TaxID=339 RepID=UPI002B22D334|nr:hypothetical protein [Xanthomonas campestris]MEA9753077.1 hypothetical protein [Xanthomonas campestris pv. raphani]MEA9813303.1 hypothetical protein [Xanthomonas campestris pv. raphani]